MLPEVVALASIVQPRLFARDPMSVDVELGGELTRGMTVFDRRTIDQWQTNIEVLTDESSWTGARGYQNGMATPTTSGPWPP